MVPSSIQRIQADFKLYGHLLGIFLLWTYYIGGVCELDGLKLRNLLPKRWWTPTTEGNYEGGGMGCQESSDYVVCNR